MSINFLDPIFYDVADIHPDAPNKPLLEELFARMNEQNERLWMFFTEICEDPEHKRMKLEFIKPRQHRASFKKKKARAMAEKARRQRFSETEEDNTGYKQFLKDEGLDDLLSPEDRDHTEAQIRGYKCRGRSVVPV
tara:strand:+ start:91 stop:498 length:408 start_codon:yes stop_codon:yes gene_type:complete